MVDAGVRAFLQAAGYRVRFRHDGFVTALVSGGAERWTGDGADEEEALDAAVSRMFPSAAAARLLAEALAGADEPTEADPPAEVSAPEPEAVDVAPADAPAASAPIDAAPVDPPKVDAPSDVPPIDVAPVAPPKVDAPSDVPPIDVAPADVPPVDALPVDAHSVDAPSVDPAPDDVPSVVADPAEEPPQDDAEPPAAPFVDPDPPTREAPRASDTLAVPEALARIDHLQAEIDDLLAEVAWCAPPVVRLQLTAWLARGRAVQRAAGHEREVEEAVRRLASRLGSVTKRWWPGNVPALQLYAVAADVDRKLDLGLDRGASWEGVADAIEQRLDEADDGWADDDALQPRPTNVQGSFQKICADLEALLGPLDREPPRSALALLDDADTRKALQEYARRLRWMRGVAPSGERWACAMGHLRWVAQHAPATRRSLDPALDPDKAPREGTWAKVLGEDPEKRRRQRRVRAVLRATPSARDGRDEVAAWLADALTLGADLTNRQVIGLLAGHADLVLGLTHEDLGDVERKVRSRLRKLQKALRAGESAAPAPELDDTDDGIEPAADADPVGDLVDAVRERVGGKKAVFISNRKDPTLKAKLEERLGLEIEWCSGSPRRVQSVGRQVAAGTFDLVILATGFTGHSADAVLGRAAAGASVPFVRAYKGRSLATLRALARDLGIRREA